MARAHVEAHVYTRSPHLSTLVGRGRTVTSVECPIMKPVRSLFLRLWWLWLSVPVLLGGWFWVNPAEPWASTQGLAQVLCGQMDTLSRKDWIHSHVETQVNVVRRLGETQKWTPQYALQQVHALRARYPNCALHLGEPDFQRRGQDQRVELDVEWSASQYGDPHARKFRVRIDFETNNGNPTVRQLWLTEAVATRPEPRP